MRLTPGDTITNVRPLTSKPGWSEGMLRRKRAHFPDSMVELHVTELYNEEVHVFLSRPSEWLYCRSCHQLLVDAQEMSCCEGMFCLKCSSRLPPQPEGLPRVFCMVNCKNVRPWSTGSVRIYGIDLTFNVSFETVAKRGEDSIRGRERIKKFQFPEIISSFL